MTQATLIRDGEQPTFDYAEAAVRDWVDFHPEEPVFEAWLIAKVRQELLTRGESTIPGAVTRSHIDAHFTDDLLGITLDASTIATRLGVSKSTARRILRQPDVTTKRGYGWFPSTVRARTGEKIFAAGLA